MTVEERHRVGRELRAARVKDGYTQSALADDVGLAVGTIQRIEYGRKHARTESVERLANFFHLSLDELRRGSARVTPTHPLLEGLNEDCLEVAQQYSRAKTRLRLRVEALLRLHPEDRLTMLVGRLEKLSPGWLAIFEELVASAERGDNPALVSIPGRRGSK
jgi:transcriptional regulator with XRE-family HTH domain